MDSTTIIVGLVVLGAFVAFLAYKIGQSKTRTTESGRKSGSDSGDKQQP